MIFAGSLESRKRVMKPLPRMATARVIAAVARKIFWAQRWDGEGSICLPPVRAATRGIFRNQKAVRREKEGGFASMG